jgi:hypothetical protein
MIHNLVITYDDQSGNMNVNGPVQNKGLCYLMLECARDAVKDHVDKNQPVAVPAAPQSNGLPAFVRKAIRPRKR